jgi:hypothetical protein
MKEVEGHVADERHADLSASSGRRDLRGPRSSSTTASTNILVGMTETPAVGRGLHSMST